MKHSERVAIIIGSICERNGVRPESLTRMGRTGNWRASARISAIRDICIYFINEHTIYKSGWIAEKFNINQNHVNRGLQRVRDKMYNDPGYNMEMVNWENYLKTQYATKQ